FFSSRRRHTRFSRDWSSDVCSSDLLDQLLTCRDRLATLQADATNIAALARDADPEWYIWGAVGAPMAQIYWNFANDLHHHLELQIGRASCRARVKTAVVPVLIKHKR